MRALSIVTLLAFILTGCTKNTTYDTTVTIAEQYGLAYAPIQIVKEKHLIEKQIPGIKIKWIRLGNTAAIREAILGGKLDIGFMGIPPFLIGWDKGMKWKIFSGLSKAELGLVTWKEDINSLSDFGPADRIALPQPGSIQHILLSMAAEKQLGKSDYFDNQLVTMKHPDGMNALLSKTDITAHFTSPPYVRMELKEPGMKMILSGKEAMGDDFTFIVGAVTDKFSKNSPEILKAVRQSLNTASNLISEKPQEAVEILEKDYSLSSKELLSYLSQGSLIYSDEVKGLSSFIRFMKERGYIQRTPENINEILIKQDTE